MKNLQNKKNQGFTLIELIVVTAIIVTLTSIAVFNFRKQRSQQEIEAAAQDMISKIREVQTNILAGKAAVSGVVPEKYEIIFQNGATSYRINYCTASACNFLETVKLYRGVSIGQLFFQGNPQSQPMTIRIISPYGQILFDEEPNAVGKIQLSHQSGDIRNIVINGISGRIGLE